MANMFSGRRWALHSPRENYTLLSEILINSAADISTVSHTLELDGLGHVLEEPDAEEEYNGLGMSTQPGTNGEASWTECNRRNDFQRWAALSLLPSSLKL